MSLSYLPDKLDYDLLEYISKPGVVHKDDVLKHFAGKISAIEYRLDRLSQQEIEAYMGNVNFYLPSPIPNSSHLLEEKGEYHITDLGQKSLEDYQAKLKHEKKQIWLVNWRIPVLVSIAVNLIWRGTELLLPHITVWLGRIP